MAHNDFPSKKLLAKYRKEKKEPVLIPKNKKNHTYKLIRTDIAATERFFREHFFRHDPHKLAKVLIMLTEFENVLSFLETEKS